MLASAVGKAIVKSPSVDVLSDPKARTTTARSAFVSLYINAPFAVTVAFENVRSAKSVIAVVPESEGVLLVNAPPPAV